MEQWGPPEMQPPGPHCLHAPIKLRFPDERKAPKSIQVWSLDPSAAISGYLAQHLQPCRAHFTEKINGWEGSGPIQEQSFCQWTKPTEALAEPSLGKGDFHHFGTRWETIQVTHPCVCDLGCRRVRAHMHTPRGYVSGKHCSNIYTA